MPDDAVIDRMRMALDLHDLGVRMYAQRLRREQPEANEVEIWKQVQHWLGARPLDAPGTVTRFHERG